jgi:predicted PhzF superfamily epimerase YddE/YHI9
MALAIFENESQIRALKPSLAALAELEGFSSVCASAPGSDCDFVSRFFAPKLGIDEDPVTGSAHTVLAPYWSAKLEKDLLEAKQLSQRGGQVICEMRGPRVAIAGRAVRYSEGFIEF